MCSVQMQRLVQACQPGDSLVFQFSGHGSQVRDYSGDEVDGLNETLLPCDFRAVCLGLLVCHACVYPISSSGLAFPSRWVLCTRQKQCCQQAVCEPCHPLLGLLLVC